MLECPPKPSTLNLMTIAKFCEKTGLSEASIRNEIARGVLRKGEHYRQKQARGRILLDYEAVLKALTGE